MKISKIKKLNLIAITLCLLGLASSSLAQTAADSPGAIKIHTLSILDEGTETKMSLDEIKDILPWAQRSDVDLKDLTEQAKTMPKQEAVRYLKKGIADLVLASAPKRTELILRYVLNRSLKVVEVIEKEADMAQPGAVEQELRVLTLSIKMAENYYQSDIKYLQDLTSGKTDIAPLPLAQFGLDYSQFLLDINESILSAKTQYSIAIMAIGYLQWDLYRDKNQTAFAPAIEKIYEFLTLMPEEPDASDLVNLDRLRRVRKLYAQVKDILKNTPLNGAIVLQADVQTAAPSATGSGSTSPGVGRTEPPQTAPQAQNKGVDQTLMNQMFEGANKVIDVESANKMIEEFYNTHRNEVTWDDVQKILSQLQGSPNDDYKHEKLQTRNRILSSYADLIKSTATPQAFVSVASAFACINTAIESYYFKNQGRLTWDDVKFLIDALTWADDPFKHGKTQTEDRIVKSWNRLHP